MSAYGEEREEAFRARGQLKDWAGEGILSDAQYRLMEAETACDLSTTNIFLRAVLFLFGAIVACAAAGLFFAIFSGLSNTATGVWLIVFAAASYGAAEALIAQKRFYRHGVEEALAVCAVGFLCVGLHNVFPASGALIPAAGAAASLWIWRRFTLPYAFVAAMIFAAWIPGNWTASQTAVHLILVVFYAVGLAAVAASRAEHSYSLAETFLWLGIYLALNLQVGQANLFGFHSSPYYPTLGYPKAFYWFTWVAIWCLPIAILLRGIRLRDRFVMAAGAVAAVLTLFTNKPYLGWPRHTWDPMLLGALLAGVALYLRRYLAAGVRHGFTAERLSGKDKALLQAGASVLGFITPQPAASHHDPDVRFGGGDSAGGGATSDF